MKIIKNIFIISVLGVIFIALILLILYSPNRPSSVGPARIPTNTAVLTVDDVEFIRLYCPECAEENMSIYLWSKPGGLADGAQTIAAFPHGELCMLLGKRGGYTRVSCLGSDGKAVIGWLATSLVKVE